MKHYKGEFQVRKKDIESLETDLSQINDKF